MVQVNVVAKRCSHPDCHVNPRFNFEGSTRGLYCSEHKLDGKLLFTCPYAPMYLSALCLTPPFLASCHMQMSSWFDAGMINVIDRRCQEANCPKFPSHNYPGSHKKLYCATHKKEGMVKIPSLFIVLMRAFIS